MKKFIEEFKAFALRGNVMDMAIGVLIAGAFSGIITSLTENFLNPVISMIMSGATYTSEDISGFATNFIGSVINLSLIHILGQAPTAPGQE